MSPARCPLHMRATCNVWHSSKQYLVVVVVRFRACVSCVCFFLSFVLSGRCAGEYSTDTHTVGGGACALLSPEEGRVFRNSSDTYEHVISDTF